KNRNESEDDPRPAPAAWRSGAHDAVGSEPARSVRWELEQQYEAERRSQLLELAVLHRYAGDAQEGRRPQTDDASAVRAEDRNQGQLLRGRELQPRVLREGAGQAVARRGH